MTDSLDRADESKSVDEKPKTDAPEEKPADGEDPPAEPSESESESVEKKEDAGETKDSEKKESAKEESADEKKKKKEKDKVRGNPFRWTRGLATTIGGALFAFLFMAHDRPLPIGGVPLGFLFILVAAWGVLDTFGTFDDKGDAVQSTTLAKLAPNLGAVATTFLLWLGALTGGQSGLYKQWMWGAIVTVTFVAFVVSVFQLGVKLGPWAKDELGEARPLYKRHGFWLIVLASILYLPALGSYSLWDPWETHYGEVAREILARDDWISLWWAQDGWFWSKPILNFWIQSLAMATMGTHFQPDRMLIGADGTANAHPEWVVRAPNFLLVILAMYLLYKGVSKVYGRRAGLMGGIVLATMPDWYFLAHQTMTDMPFVATMTCAMGLLLMGLNTNEEQKVGLYEVNVGSKSFRLTAWHLVFGALLMCALPQILYLLSRNIELVLNGDGAKGFRAHWDTFKSGSGMANCGLPGNEACNPSHPAAVPHVNGVSPESFGGILLRFFGGFEPALQAVLWGALLSWLLYLNWGERRLQRMYFLAAWFFAAIATMAKGPAGFGLPMLCAFAYLATKKKWSMLTRVELWSGLLVIACVALPWYVAMYVRHGSPFTDRLIFHDMFNRAFNHVHDTNEGEDTSFRFYIWQLGYALFPWTGLVPLGLVYWLRRSDSAGAKGDTSILLVMWFVFAFALFSFMGTKFHHYIFPAVPPAAMLLGIVLDDMLAGKLTGPWWRWMSRGVGFAGLALVVVELATGFFKGSFWGNKVAHWERIDTILLIVGGIACVVGIGLPIVYGLRKKSEPEPESESEPEDTDKSDHTSMMLGAATLAAVFVIAIVGRDLATKAEGGEPPGAIRLLHLFTYNYRRPWPDDIDFRPVLAAFGVTACLAGLFLVVRPIRRWATVAFCSVAFVWALWGLNVYMWRTSPHWGQHEVIEAYYRDRHGPEEPIIAYQMNWKGENFYTSNRIPAYVSSGSNFTSWVKQQKEKGVKVMYFVTEHSRTGGLRSEAQAKSYREVTDKTVCNKFVLVRAEL